MKRVQFKVLLNEDDAAVIKAALAKRQITFTEAIRQAFKIPVRKIKKLPTEAS